MVYVDRSEAYAVCRGDNLGYGDSADACEGSFSVVESQEQRLTGRQRLTGATSQKETRR